MVQLLSFYAVLILQLRTKTLVQNVSTIELLLFYLLIRAACPCLGIIKDT